MVVAGARPQWIALAGVDALTAAERRVADFAAQGLTKREIAETLFVTRRTVEVHLGHAYGKLGIEGPVATVRGAHAGVETPPNCAGAHTRPPVARAAP